MEILLSKLRKKRVIKKKDRSTIMIIILIIMVMTIIIGIIILNPKSKSNNESMPEEIPDIRGEVIEKEGDETLCIQSISGLTDSVYLTEVENVTIDGNTKIFWMVRRDGTVKKASSSDISIGTKIAVWGIERFDGTWRARDIGIIKERSRMKNGN
jgi:hypothetical protein